MSDIDVRARILAMFPRVEEVPVSADFAAAGGTFPDGDIILIDGELRRWQGELVEVTSPVCVQRDGVTDRRLMGHAASVSREIALEALGAAVRAWDNGRGPWPTRRVAERIAAVEDFVERMKKTREEVVRLLMWEIGKSRPDAEKEFDRTVSYIEDTVEATKELDRSAGRFSNVGGVLAQIRRSPLGVTLCMGPFNYPLNETFTTLIPAVIMGNPVVVKLPRFGHLCQVPLLRCFAEAFPKGVVNVINGKGRTVATAIVEEGSLRALAFIGSSNAANVLKKEHPRPNRLRCILGLDAKNPGIILPDADLELTVKECVTGALSFNGQRCTGLKLLFVHRSMAERFVERLCAKVDALPFGLPWEAGVKLTPLPELEKGDIMDGLVEDARRLGASVANRYGGIRNRTFYFPAVVYPVPPAAKLYTVEQFGPVVPVATYEDISEVMDFVETSSYGQQASVFGRDPSVVGPLVDVLSNQVCRVNLNAQCQRGPDVYPFAGRKDSAEGTLSVSDALRCFSIRSMVAATDTLHNRELIGEILTRRTSNFVNTDYLF